MITPQVPWRHGGGSEQPAVAFVATATVAAAIAAAAMAPAEANDGARDRAVWVMLRLLPHTHLHPCRHAHRTHVSG